MSGTLHYLKKKIIVKDPSIILRENDPLFNYNHVLLPFEGENNSSIITDYMGKSIVNVNGNITNSIRLNDRSSSLYLNGVDSYIEIPSTAPLLGNQNFTIEVWQRNLRTYSIDGNIHTSIVNEIDAGGAKGFSIIQWYPNPGGVRYSFSVQTDKGNIYQQTSDNPSLGYSYNDYQIWTHYALERYNNYITFYRAGQPIISASIPTAAVVNYQSGLKTTIGKRSGYIDWKARANYSGLRITIGQARYKGAFTPSDSYF